MPDESVCDRNVPSVFAERDARVKRVRKEKKVPLIICSISWRRETGCSAAVDALDAAMHSMCVYVCVILAITHMNA